MNLTQSRVDAASAGFRALHLTAYEAAKPNWPRIAMKVTSNGAEETYDFGTGFPQMREMIGEANIQNIEQAGFTIRNKEFESTVGVKVADVQRDKLGVYANRFSEMGRGAAFHPDQLTADLLNGAFTQKDYTGKAFFADDKKHNPDDSSKNAVKFTNKITTALTEAGFVEARTNLRKRKDAKGNSYKLGHKLVLVVPPALEHTAETLMNSTLIDNSDNVLKGAAEVLVIDELTSDTAWFLMDDSREVKPLVVQYEVDPQWSQVTNLNDSYVVTNKKFLYQIYDRKNAGYGLPQLACGSTGAG